MPNTINGTNGANNLVGTGGADLIYGYSTAAADASTTGITLTLINAKSGQTRPLDIDANPVDGTHLFICTQPGLINVIDLETGKKEATPFLDLQGQIAYREDLGLTSLVFDPDFASNGKLYVYVAVDKDVGGVTETFNEIWSYTVDPNNPLIADPASRDVIASFPQPGEEHRVGHLAFGPDGYLYLSRGDGNNPYDAFHTAQDITGNDDLVGGASEGLLGKVLRIDVRGDDFPGDPNRDYAIPPDNPFAGATAGADEIWAVGVRNMWRYSFDRVTGDFYGGDVGQVKWEEVDYLPAGSAPPNFGWGWRGWEAYEQNPDNVPPDGLPSTGLIFPVDHYFHDDPSGQYSVTSGYVYRGTNEALQGHYFYADFGQGWLRTLEKTAQIDPANGLPVFDRTDWTSLINYANAGTARLDRPPTFGEDAEGNLYIQDIDGNLFRVDATAPSTGDGGDTIAAGGGDDWVFAGAGNDTATGEAGNDTLSGMLGSDTLLGGDGSDSLLGAVGGDELRGESGDDSLLGGAGSGDTLIGGAGDDALDGGEALGDVAVFSGMRADYAVTDLSGVAFRLVDMRTGSPDGTDVVREIEIFRFADGDVAAADLGSGGGGTPTDGPDSLLGTAARDTIGGLGGNDTINGLGDKDRILGNDGDDLLIGSAGNDRLIGGLGVDQLNGGIGKDQFRFDDAAESPAATPDMVLDFASAEGDVIFLRRAASGTTFIGTDAFHGTGGAEVRYAIIGADTRIELDAGGDGVADLAVILQNVSGVAETDFRLG